MYRPRLSFYTQWPIWPVAFKSGPKFLFYKSEIFWAIHCITNRRMWVWPLFLLPMVIYYYVFCQYSTWQTMLLLESWDSDARQSSSRSHFENNGWCCHAYCMHFWQSVSRYRYLYSKIWRRTGPDTVYKFDYYSCVLFLSTINLCTEVQSYGKLSCALAAPGMNVAVTLRTFTEISHRLGMLKAYGDNQYVSHRRKWCDIMVTLCNSSKIIGVCNARASLRC